VKQWQDWVTILGGAALVGSLAAPLFRAPPWLSLGSGLGGAIALSSSILIQRRQQRDLAQQLAQVQNELTAARETSAQQQAEVQRWQQFLARLPVGVSIHNASGEPIYLNQAARELFGLAPNDDARPHPVTPYQIYRAGTGKFYPPPGITRAARPGRRGRQR